jgi:hypothetical protein
MKLEQDLIVAYNNGVISGIGRIKGIAITEQPYIGATYIIEDVSKFIPNDTYPYTHLVMAEIHIRLADKRIGEIARASAQSMLNANLQDE